MSDWLYDLMQRWMSDASVVGVETHGFDPGELIPVSYTQAGEQWWVVYRPDGSIVAYNRSRTMSGEEAMAAAVRTIARLRSGDL